MVQARDKVQGFLSQDDPSGLPASDADRSLAGRASTNDLLRIRNIVKHYGTVAAVDDVCVDVRDGEFLTLLGPSGSGKTTLLMMLAGFVAPTAGEILLAGRDVAALPPERRNFGMVFQGYALFPHMSVFDNVAFPLSVRRQPSGAVRDKVLAALRLVHMEDFADRMPKALSGGQQQRVALARAIVFDPQVLLLDEPLGALDRQLRANLQDELKALHRRLGTTFVCVTHDQEEAMSMSDRVVVMRNGRIIQIGAPTDLYQRPRTRFVANFLGESNIIAARSVERQGAFSVVELAGQQLAVGGAESDAGDAHLAVRPEQFALDDRPPSPSSSGFGIQGRIADLTFVGMDYRVHLETELGPLIVRTRGSDQVRLLVRDNPVWAHCPATAFWRVIDD